MNAAGSNTTPFSGFAVNSIVEVPGAPPMSEGERTSLVIFITPGWFAAYGTAIRVGRDVDDRDTKSAPSVVLVNEAFARAFFPGRNPIGGAVAYAFPRSVPVPKTVVGVVSNAVYQQLRDGVRPTMYVPLAQWDLPIPLTDVGIAVRSSAGSPVTLARSVAAALTAVDRDLVFTFRPLADQVNAAATQERLVATLSGFFGALALLLAGLGLYGVTSYAVTRRRTEIGIRMALGAEPAGVVRLVLSRVSVLVGLGVIVGAGVSVWAAQFVATMLYGLQPRDPVTLVGAAVTLAAVGALAGWLPAYRASRIDPVEILRDI